MTVITPSPLRSPINYCSWSFVGVLVVNAKALNQGTKCVFYWFLQLTCCVLLDVCLCSAALNVCTCVMFKAGPKACKLSQLQAFYFVMVT